MAESIRASLETRGVSVVSADTVPLGDTLASSIERGIEEADGTVVIVSANESPSIEREVEIAKEKRVPVFSVMVADRSVPKEAEREGLERLMIKDSSDTEVLAETIASRLLRDQGGLAWAARPLGLSIDETESGPEPENTAQNLNNLARVHQEIVRDPAFLESLVDHIIRNRRIIRLIDERISASEKLLEISLDIATKTSVDANITGGARAAGPSQPGSLGYGPEVIERSLGPLRATRPRATRH
jgi:hypothetical protein